MIPHKNQSYKVSSPSELLNKTFAEPCRLPNGSYAPQTLLNSNTEIGIQETGNFQTNKINMWCWGHVINPELFFKISIKTDESPEWLRAYEIFKINT